jgi:hypothetical protein
MNRWTRNTALVLCGAFALSIALVGCSGKQDFATKDRNKDGYDEEPKDKPSDNPNTAVGLKPIQGKGLATLKGTIKLTGEDPDYEALTKSLLAEIDKAAADRPVCLAGSEPEKSQFSWVVDKGSRGVNNVFVWIRPDDDKKEFFDVKAMVEKVQGFDKVKTIDQPHCAFMPHAVVIFPRYVDPANPSTKWNKPAEKGGPPRTPQEFLVKNTGSLNHNTKTESTDTARLTGINSSIPPGSMVKIDDIKPAYGSAVEVKCSVHPWMKSWVWAFEHPFACVTGSKVGDKQLAVGEYRIENIPAGVKLRVVAWHEEARFIINNSEKGEEITLKEGETTRDFTITARK